MKKVLFVISILLFASLIGCSASMSLDEVEVNVDQSIEYNFTSLSFNSISEGNLLNYVKDDYVDFEMMLQKANEEDIISESYEDYATILETLKEITVASNLPFKVLATYTMGTLNDTASAYDIKLTVDDIVQFYNLQLVLEKLSGSDYITVRDFLEYRLGRTITDEEKYGLQLLQRYYWQLYIEYGDYDLPNKTIEDFEADLIVIGYTNLSTDDYDSMSYGLDLLKTLLDDSPDE